MRTKGDFVIDTALQAYAEGMHLASLDHTLDQMLSFLKDVGSQIELYLRDTVYGGAHKGWVFKRLIDELGPLGVPQTTIANLHIVRDSYNSAKHDPTYAPSTSEILGLLRLAQSAVREVVACALGSSQSPLPQTYRRLFWLGAWDHFIGGDTEIQVLLPSDEPKMAPRVDLLYIDATKWNEVKAGLQSVGALQLGPTSVPKEFFDECAGESDFLEAGTFEGSYRDLLSVLAKRERVEEILPFLKREADFASMRGAIFLAAADAAAEGDVDNEERVATEQILVVASHRYAVPRNAQLGIQYAEAAARLLVAVPLSQRRLITGPFWVSADTFDRAAPKAIARIKDIPALVAKDFRLMVKLS